MRVCVCVSMCVRTVRSLMCSIVSSRTCVGAEYLDNGWRQGLGSSRPPIGNNIWRIDWSPGHVIDDVTLPVAGGRRSARLAEVVVFD